MVARGEGRGVAIKGVAQGNHVVMEVFFFNFYSFIYLFFGCIGSSLLHAGFL